MRLVFTVVCALSLCVAHVLTTDHTWDDAAITLGYSRTLAEHGFIGASQYSEVTEGYSTFLYMIAGAGLFSTGLSPSTVLYLAKLSGLVFSLISLLLLYRLASRTLVSDACICMLLTAYTFSATMLHAVKDGMETALYGCLVLAITELYFLAGSRIRTAVMTALACILVLVRWEAVLFLLPIGFSTLKTKGWRIVAWPVFYAPAVMFAAYHVWHYWYFGSTVTGPMLAKSNPVYNYSTGATLTVAAAYRLRPFLQLWLEYWPVVVYAAACVILAAMHRCVRPRTLPLAVLTTAAVGTLVAVLAGDCWGAAPRLAWPGIPFMLLVVLVPFDSRGPRRDEAIKWLLCAAASAYLAFATYCKLPRDSSGATVANVGEIGRGIGEVARLANLEKLTYAGPDMGGLLLFHGNGKRIIDLGLLCDPELPAKGYGHVYKYLFTQERPEIIEVHDCWMYATQLYRMREFYEQYYPCKLDTLDKYLFIRRDILTILAQRITVVSLQPRQPTTLDEAVIAQFGSYGVIDTN
jgi:hypothetical protein